MDSATASLLFALVGGCGVWWLTRSLVRRRVAGSEPDPSVAASSTEDTAAQEKLFRTLLYLRLAGIALCVAAAGVLFWGLGTGFAACLAGAGCLLQFAAYRVRVSQHS